MAYGSRDKVTTSSPSLLPNPKKLTAYFFLFFSLYVLLLFRSFPPPPSSIPRAAGDTCDPAIAPFYVYSLPPRFNRALLRRCRSLSAYTDMCPHVAGGGLGRPLTGPLLPSAAPAASSSSWFATHQFLAEMLFHARAARHPCRTGDLSRAELFYVPFYAGLYASSQFREPNHTRRDALALDFAAYLSKLPSWPRRHGRDHFLVSGRTAWDFMRRDEDTSSADFGANRLLTLPETANVTVLTVERHPWEGENQRGIPYPSYFHPRSRDEVEAWKAAALLAERTHLFAFIGGPRISGAGGAAEAREEILRQCAASARCLRSECAPGAAACHEPAQVLDVMRRAEFCMQPPGDSFTRRSVFDAVLAGCVPVFFSEHTAYSQYSWYAPAAAEGGGERWSVLVPAERWGRIEEELARIPREEVARMRKRVVEMIPRVTYAHPNASHSELGFRDAVDVALVELTMLVPVGSLDALQPTRNVQQ